MRNFQQVCVRVDGEEVTDESELAEYYTTIADQLLISGQPDAAQQNRPQNYVQFSSSMVPAWPVALAVPCTRLSHSHEGWTDELMSMATTWLR